jgi:ribosomal protein S2
MAIDRAVLDFERVLSRKDPGEIQRAREKLEKFLDGIEFGTMD